MHPMRFGSRTERKQAIGLVEECEKFLTGGLAEHSFRTTGFVPDWTWINLLAHGTYPELVRARDKPTRALHGEFSESGQWFNRVERWRRARSYLAAEVLDVAGSQGQLVELQRRTLLPLEQELASCQGSGASDLKGWVNLVVAALDEHRRCEERARRSELRFRAGSDDSASGPVR